jgi:hypothetical protein
MLAPDELLNKALILARPVEAAIRQVVELDLQRVYGPEWRLHIPQTLNDKLIEQRQTELGAGRDRGPSILEYASLNELIDLMRSEVGIFARRFSDEEGWDGLEEFRKLRNPLMHGNRLATEECDRIIELSRWIIFRCEANIPIDQVTKTQPTQSRTGGSNYLDPKRAKFFEIMIDELQGMSGKMISERDLVMTFLKEYSTFLSIQVIEAVQEKFKGLEGSSNLIDELYMLIPPTRPERPSKQWDIKKWLKWGDRKFLPYRAWMDRADIKDDEIELDGLLFEEWIFENYPTLLEKADPTLVSMIYQQIEELLIGGKNIFWLVIDNLAAQWIPAYRRCLERSGFREEEYQPRLAMVPSVTAVSRLAMLAGRMPDDAMMSTITTSEEVAFNELWTTRMPELRAKFCGTLNQAEEAVTDGCQLIAIVYNRIDKRLHQADDGWFDLEADIENDLDRMFERIGPLVRKMNTVRETKLVITSDHGSLKLPKNVQVVNLPKSAIPEQEIAIHRRNAAITDLDSPNKADWFVLEKKRFRLPNHFAVTRGNRSIGARPRGYVHGGFSPEEMVSHWIVTTPGLREDLKLTFSFAGDPVRVGQKSAFAIRVNNPFYLDVEDLELEIAHLELTFDKIEIPRLSHTETEARMIEIPDIMAVHKDRIRVRLSCKYLLGSKPIREAHELLVPVARIYKSDIDDFEGLFDD